jgi:hypothetical protein
MAMIELIFAIVIIAISVMTIPSMMNVANESAKRILVDDDTMVRLKSQAMDKFQARWGGEYNSTDGESNRLFMNISNLETVTDLNCSRVIIIGGPPNQIEINYRNNPNSTVMCGVAGQMALEIPNTTGNGANQADGNVSKGIEKLNGGTETLSVTASSGEVYTVNATYGVSYVPSVTAGGVLTNSNTETATWRLGSSGMMIPVDGDLGAVAANRTNLKRVVIRFWDNNLGVDTTLTFFKSNKGGA